MTSFILQVLQELLARKEKISDYTFILPSKRAGSYLTSQLNHLIKVPVFSPKTFSIENFTEEMSGLKAIDNTTALFEFYSIYLEHTPKENIEDFEVFSSWAQTLLYDFNEIDRYLIDHKSFFGYLSEIQEMNHWYLQKERTPLMVNYLSFWEKLSSYYEQLKQALQKKNLAYQGMVYRLASEKVQEYIKRNTSKHIFIGFNALNNAEQHIVQQMLSAGTAEVFWDIDEVFLRDEQHATSYFMRQYLRTWPHFQDNDAIKPSADFSKKKNIEIVGVPKNIGQAKFVGELLSQMNAEELKNTAVVLGDESLLLPVLNSLPPNVEEVNVTMGFPLKNAPVTSLFQHLLKMHSENKEQLYYKEVLGVTNHPLIQRITSGVSTGISAKIQEENLVYFGAEKLIENIQASAKNLFDICFRDWGNNPATAIDKLQELILFLRSTMDKEKDQLQLEFLYQYHLLFNKLSNLLETYPHLTSIKTLFSIYKDLLSAQTVDFRGKPFTGLQLMGMLESRVLDFKNVILTSVNEGVLPAGKSSNSFIPYDLKCSYKLPTFREKDAIYTYHFYSLIQRAENIHLLYNTESEGLNAGEKSRFLLQLEMEKQEAHHIKKYHVAPKVPAVRPQLHSITKTPEILDKLKELAKKGFSPSALTTYIRNPLDFYHQYVLGVRKPEDVEETIAYNTLGTVVHNTLETFYRDWENKNVDIALLKKAFKKTPEEITAQFKKTYTKAPLAHGKNLLIFEVAKRYVINLLRTDIRQLEEGNTLRIVQVENNLKCKLQIANLDFPVFIRGKVDRVDEFNGKKRIIDYKTGKVQPKQVEIVNWEDLNSDYDKYSKSFQVLSYAFMLNHVQPFSDPVEAGIISFKNMKGGFLRFCKKEEGKAAAKSTDIQKETLEAFETQLKSLVSEICNPDIPFIEKEIPTKSW